jgi:hypothetical protein
LINCAANVELTSKLDLQLKVNVTGPLNLLRMFEECPNPMCFVQVSTTFALSDRKGFIEERNYDSAINWPQMYKKILTMNARDMAEQQKAILGDFPDTYCFSKRMAEELLQL